MEDDPHAGTTLQDLLARVGELERRVAALEASPAPRPSTTRAQGHGGGEQVDASGWTQPYRVAALEPSETWIELHEQSARPQLQRLIRQVVEEEGPATDRLVLDRVRRAWGLRRAGGRVVEAFEQSVRQLLARGLVERDGDALRTPGSVLEVVRVPGEDEESRRGAEDVPLVELALAIERVASGHGRAIHEDELTMQVARLFGWTRRGGAIQERLTAALDVAERDGRIVRSGSTVAPAA